MVPWGKVEITMGEGVEFLQRYAITMYIENNFLKLKLDLESSSGRVE